MKALTFGLIIVIMLATPAVAAPGDPRMIHGTLEWPPTLTKEPFVVVRGDDGLVYYAQVASAQRRGAPSAGARVTILGIEGAHVQEVVAMLVAVNDSAGASRSAVPGGSAAVPAAAPPSPAAPHAATTSPAAPSGAAVSAAAPSPTSATAAAATGAAPSAAAPTSAAATPAAAGAAAPSAAASNPAARSAPAPAPAASSPSPPTTAGASATGPAQAPAIDAARATARPAASVQLAPPSVPAAVVPSTSVPTVAVRGAATAEPVPSASPSIGESQRWTEIHGVVQAFADRTLILRADDGQRVVVDVSALSPGFAQMVTIGSVVKVYGVPVEQRFKASGFIDTSVGRRR